MMSYQVYILESLKDRRTYTGFSRCAGERLKVHNAGKVSATKQRAPLRIIYKENVQTLVDAKKREQYWKSGAGRRKLQKFYKGGFPPIIK